jgi:AcrR family transcriptional regulator
MAGLDRVSRVVPLVVATVNDLSQLSGASCRRFDRRLVFERLDETAARAIMVDTPEEVQQQAIDAGLLAHYLKELNFRAKCGTQDLVEALTELAEQQLDAGTGKVQSTARGSLC